MRNRARGGSRVMVCAALVALGALAGAGRLRAGGSVLDLRSDKHLFLDHRTIESLRRTIGNSLRHAAAWQAGSDVARLAGREVRLRFVMRDAKLYAIQFVP
jgi:hypothetical protein